MSIPRDLIKMALTLTVAAVVGAGIATIVTWSRSRRTEGDQEYHPWDHTIAPSDSAR